MAKKRNPQLELPVLVNINEKSTANKSSEGEDVVRRRTASDAKQASASDDDKLIYRAIADNYFSGNN